MMILLKEGNPPSPRLSSGELSGADFAQSDDRLDDGMSTGGSGGPEVQNVTDMADISV